MYVYAGKEKCIQGFGGKTVGKRPLGRPRRRWEYKTKMNMQKVGCGAWTGTIGLETGRGDGHL
jgi:hypothetical protein